MKALRLATLVATVSLVGFVSTASAEAPAPVLFSLHPTHFGPEVGPWEASGAITDSGSFVQTFAQTAPPDRPFGVPGPFREVFVLDGSQGTLTIKDESVDTGSSVTGVWQVVSGTGVYEDASGHGTLSFSVSPGPIFTLSLTGVISKVG